MTAQTQANLDALAAQITQIVNVDVPGGELFSGVAYPITFDVGDINVENFGSLTDKDGNTWTLTPGAQWWYGGLAENGTQLWTGYNVALRLVNGDVWVEEAKFGGWWNLTVGAETNNLAGRPDEGADPGQSTAGTGTSGSSTGVITSGVGSVSPPTPPTGAQTQANLDALAAQITQIVNVDVPGGELFSGVAYPITFDVGDINVENFGSLTDKDGNTWTLTPGAQWWYGGLAENGTQLWTGYNVALRLVNSDVWVEEAKFGGWWNLTVGAETNNLAGRPDEGPDPGQSTAGTGTSGSSTGVITSGVGSVSPPTPPTGAQTQANLDALAAQITQIVNVDVPGGELFSGVAYPITFDVGDINVENFGSLTDKDGNTWTLTPGAQWWYGGLAENGTQLWTGYNVALRLVNSDVWVEEAKFGGWWNLTVGAETNNLAGRPDEGPDPGQSTAGTGTSGSSTGVITSGVGSVSPPTPPTGAQTQANLDALAAQITQIVNVDVPGGELFSGVAYPITFDVGDINVENFGSLTDKDGNTWTLTPGAQWWYGGLAENGTQLWTGYNVALRLVNGDVWVEEAKFGGWWNLTVGAETNNLAGRPDEGADPGQSTAGTGTSGSSTGVITSGVGSVSPPTPPTGAQTQANLDALAAQITQIVNVDVPGGELFSGVAYPITFDVGDINVENFGSLTDKDGNTWTLTPGAQWWYGGLAENGTQLWTGYNVALRLVNSDVWVEEAKFGGWWNLTVGAETNNLAGRPDEGPDPGQSTAGTGTSGSSTDFITPGVGSFKDAAGNTYTIDAVGNADENGAAIPNGSGTAAMEYYNSAVYGEDAGTSQWYTWNQTTWSAAAAPPSPSSGSTTAVTTGTGSDTLVLSISEDAYANGDGTSDANGDAAFTVSVDGKQLAGIFYATASHSAGASQTFTFKGNWAPGAHTVTVAFLNDAYAGTPSTDRNLYVNDVTYDGTDLKQSATLMSTGSQTFSVTDSTAIPPVVTGGGSDLLVVKVSEDYYLANAQFTVAVDGKQLGGTFTATTLHSSGNSQTFAFAGDFGSGQHMVSVNFLNDAYAGTPATDRNLYVNDIVYNGTDSGQTAALMRTGAKTFSVSGGTTPSVSETGDHGSLLTNLSQTGTYTVGGDTFVLGSGNADTVTLGTGTSQIKFVGPSSVTLTGGAGQATVTADAGNNKFVAGTGSLDVAGGAGKDAYVFHTTSGLLTLEDFSLAKGDTLTIDKSLQGSLHQASDGVGGTMLSFGTTGHGVDIHGLTALPSSNVVWA